MKITELFPKELLKQFKENSQGNLTGPCPSCGLGFGGQSNSSGFIINVDSNNCHCFSSNTNFNFIETGYLLAGEISCKDGRMKI